MTEQIIELLQRINKAIEGINTAPIKYPGSLQTANLPTVIVWPGRGTTRPITARATAIQTERVYSVRVFVEPIGQSNYDIPSWTAIELLERFIEVYFRNEVLLDGYAKIISISDSGVMSGGELAVQAGLTYAGVAYRGFVLSVTVTEVKRLD
jgi:hypothetical protein